MKRFWTALAVILLAVFAVAGCNDYGNTFQFPTGAALISISPSQMPAGSGTFVLTMNGRGFVPQTKVQWNTKTCPISATAGVLTGGASCTTTVTTDANGNVLTVVATVGTSLIAKPGLATVNTISPASGAGNNGLSNTINFIIGNPPNPVPTVSAVSPTCATVGSGLSLTVTGTNFLNGSTDPTQISTVIWTLGASQGQFNAPAASTSTQITVQVPSADINAAGSATVTVSNPPSLPVPSIPGSVGSGGGTSPITAATTVAAQTSPCPVAAKTQANAESAAAVAEETPAVSRDGRYVAYTAVQNERSQIFSRDTCEGATTACQPHTSVLSVAIDGSAAANDSHNPSMSADGRYVAFSSDATNLVENTPTGRQVYLRDTCAGADESCKPSTMLVSTDPRGSLVGAESILPSVSSSGRFIAFLAVTRSHAAEGSSVGTKSSVGATNSGFRQVFVRDTCLGATNCTPKTTRISLQPGDGIGSEAGPAGPALSGPAKHVAIAGANAATLFTRSTAVDDSVFLAITSDQR